MSKTGHAFADGHHVQAVEFGAGTGHLGLLLAHLRPDASVVLVEAPAGRVGRVPAWSREPISHPSVQVFLMFEAKENLALEV